MILIMNLIILNISDVIAKIIQEWNMIILLISYENIYYKLWPLLRILIFWGTMIDIGGKCSYTEKVLYMILQNG